MMADIPGCPGSCCEDLCTMEAGSLVSSAEIVATLTFPAPTELGPGSASLLAGSVVLVAILVQIKRNLTLVSVLKIESAGYLRSYLWYFRYVMSGLLINEQVRTF